MDNRVPGLIVGACLLLFGAGMLYLQLAATRRREREPLERLEREYYQRQHRRRVQVAILILLIAILIPIGDSLIPWENAAATFALFWLTVLGLALWTMLLAIGDMASTLMFSNISQRQLQKQRAELEQAAEQLRQARSDRDGLQ